MKFERWGFILWRYLLFFLLICFVVTASFMLFGHSMHLDEAEIRAAAPLVFANITLLSLTCCAFEWLLHRFTVLKPVRRIREATHRIASGDFTARVDIDQFFLLGEDYADIARDINLMAGELSQTETLRTDFVSNVSHEMKTPLAVIRNYAVMLKQPNLTDEDRAACAEGIDRTVQRMTALITNILKLNKLEHQQLQARPVECDLSELVTACALGFDEAMADKDIELEADIEEGVAVTADPELLSLVWNNLLSNAVKFTPPGGAVSVSVAADGDDAVVCVRDTGCGMDEATGRRIFDKFYQGDTSHAAEGNGLGLALVKRVVDLTGGMIDVESEEGRGSAFTVRLRRAGA